MPINEKESAQFIEKVEQVAQKLEGAGQYIADEMVMDFQATVKKLKNNIHDISTQNRELRIGIIGEVKAGKSSFINALLFKGKDILPQAPTPMTAALTKIGYSDRFEAKIVFYTKEDWRIIESNAERARQMMRDLYEKEGKRLAVPIPFSLFEQERQADLPKELQSCLELIEMAERNKLNVYEHIGHEEKFEIENQDQFMDKLNQYVGAHGQFTPIVKYTELKMKLKELEGIELVDTPGMNDPIVSRTITTADFLMNCDVVFFLSYAGQFLTRDEINLLARSLPDNSVQEAYIIASKLDSALLDYSKRESPIQEAIGHTVNNLNKQALQIFSEYKNDPMAPPVLKMIEKQFPPHATSSLFYSAAYKLRLKEPLSEHETLILNQFESRFTGFQRDPKYLMTLSNIRPLQRETLDTVKEKKDTIIEERANRIIHDQHAVLLRMMSQMDEQARENYQELDSSDVQTLQKKIEQITEKLNNIRRNIRHIFEESSVKAASLLNDTKIDVDKEINNHIGVKVDANTSSSDHTRRVGFLGLKKESYTTTTTTYTAQVTDVVASTRQYVTRTKEIVNGEFKRLFDIHQLKKDISEEVIGAFDLVSNDFNENEIRRTLEIALNRLTIQDIEVNASTYDQKLTTQFSTAAVNNELISDLQLAQERILQEAAKDIKAKINEKIVEVEITLGKYSATFIDDIEQQLVTNTNKIQAMLSDKKNNLKRLDQFIKDIQKLKRQLV